MVLVMGDQPRVVQRVPGVCGELVLRRAGDAFEIIANGMFLMDTRDGRSERQLATAAADAMRPGGRMLIGGLGVGYSVRAALDRGVGEIVVVERETAVIDWNRGPLAAGHGDVLADPRVRCVAADLVEWLGGVGEAFDAICLDIDNGPEWTVTADNAALYGDTGIAGLRHRLHPGGVLAVWSAAASPAFEAALRARFADVSVRYTEVARGEPDVVYLAVDRPRRPRCGAPRLSGAAASGNGGHTGRG